MPFDNSHLKLSEKEQKLVDDTKLQAARNVACWLIMDEIKTDPYEAAFYAYKTVYNLQIMTRMSEIKKRVKEKDDGWLAENEKPFVEILITVEDQINNTSIPEKRWRQIQNRK